jgi:hypothetical protein
MTPSPTEAVAKAEMRDLPYSLHRHSRAFLAGTQCRSAMNNRCLRDVR